MTDIDFRDQLIRAIADAAARDIKGDFPQADVMYDLYVEDIHGRFWGKTRTHTLALIDMGEWFQAVYRWDYANNRWEVTDLDPVAIKEAITTERI